MSKTPDGIDMMRARMARAQRVPPPPRRAVTAPATPSAPAESTPGGERESTGTAAPVERPPARPNPRPRATAQPSTAPRLAAGDPPVNLAIRVRRPLDEHLVEVLHQLRRTGVRSSKVELIEMLLWELPAEPAAVRARLAAFRQVAPRGADAV